MRLALIVTTYERPDALARVLETVARQSVAPDELLVADDGSGPATGEVVAGFKSGAAFPVRHVWLPHDGYRVGRMRNRAIAASDADFIVIVDGDMLPHPARRAGDRARARIRRDAALDEPRPRRTTSPLRPALAGGEPVVRWNCEWAPLHQGLQPGFLAQRSPGGQRVR